MALVGLALLLWSGVVWKWGDPFTALYTSWEQRQLDDELAQLIADRPTPPPAVTGPGRTPEALARQVREEARRSSLI